MPVFAVCPRLPQQTLGSCTGHQLPASAPAVLAPGLFFLPIPFLPNECTRTLLRWNKLLFLAFLDRNMFWMTPSSWFFKWFYRILPCISFTKWTLLFNTNPEWVLNRAGATKTWCVLRSFAPLVHLRWPHSWASPHRSSSRCSGATVHCRSKHFSLQFLEEVK